MDAAHRDELKALFEQAIALPSDERVAFLNEACAADAALRDELTSLLAHHDKAPGFFDSLANAVLPQAQADEAPAPPERDPSRLIGSTISHYQIEEKLGGGGMGVVYKAHDLKLKRTVALKFLPPELTRDEQAKQRFMHEAQAASALDHVNVGYIHEVDEAEDGRLFIAMAYYAGETLKAKIVRGPLPAEEALDYATQMAQGLSKAHGAGIVHRDVKPANVMVTDNGMVKIVDFGLAKVAEQTQLTKTGMTLGTVAYMSPEQARGELVDHRTDLWSLGVVLYEMLTGQRPFKGDYEQAVIYSVLNEDPASVSSLRPEVPAAVGGVVDRLLEKDPAERPESAGEVLAALQDVERARPHGRLLSERKRRMRRRLVAGGIAVLAAVVFFMLVDNYLLEEAAPAYEFARGEVDALAVLPLQLLNNDADEEYLAAGMTSSLINELSKIESLNVISRTSVRQYSESNTPLTEIAAALGVDVIIEGTVIRIGDQVRITASLVPAQSNMSVWSESYDRDLGDILAMHTEIAKAVAAQVRLELSEDDVQRLVAPAPATAYVQNLILEGEYEFHNSDRSEGLKLLEAATLAAPDYAPAWVALAEAYWASSSFDLAKEAASKALALDRNLSDAHMVLGGIAFYQDWDWDQALQSLNRSVELNPGNGSALQILGDYYEMLGDWDRSIRLGLSSVRAAPNSVGLLMNLGLTYNYSGDYQKGLESCDTGEPPGDMPAWNAICVAEAYIGLEDFENAVRYASAALGIENFGQLQQSLMAVVLGAAGYTDRAEEIRTQFEELAMSEYVSPYTLALVAFGAGDIDQFFSYLETAIAEKAAWTPWFASTPHFASVRDDPRFAVLVAKLDLPGE